MPGQPALCMHSDLRVVLGLQELLKARCNPLIRWLVPGEDDDCASPNADARILADYPHQARHRIQVTAPLPFARVTPEGVCSPFPHLGMLVTEGFEREAP